MTATALAPALAHARPACGHCGLPTDGATFCCAGCETVHALLHEQGLDRYYQLGQGTRPSDGERVERADTLWLERTLAEQQRRTGLRPLHLDVQGMHCSACVWLFQELFRRCGARGSVLCSPATGRCELLIDEHFPLRTFIEDLSRFGYRFGPAGQSKPQVSHDLVWRMGVCVSIAMNTMIYAVAIYAGLREGALYTLFRQLDFALSVAAVAIGGPVFFRSAWASLKRGVFHLDLPIALGIVLAFTTSVHDFFRGGDNATYFDTLNIFIALMLTGRFLQERALQRTRSYLLESNGARDLLARRIDADGAVQIVSAPELERDDVVLLTPGDLLPASAVLSRSEAQLSLDWINGESTPVRFAAGDVVPAGAFLTSEHAVEVRLTERFADSALTSLLRRHDEQPERHGLWQRYVRAYVAITLSTALLTFVYWTVTVDVWRALQVVAGVLIITCPCAVGIAVPLAYDLAHAGLRRRGLHVRKPGFLDRLLGVRQIVFDKTGTLTTGRLRLRDAAPLAALPSERREQLYNLALRSSHPKSEALRAPLEALGARYRADFAAQEVPGRGVAHGELRLGAPGWAAPADGSGADVVFGDAQAPIAALHTEELLRPGAEADLAALAKEGLRLGVLSGDDDAKVAALAQKFGAHLAFAHGSAKPQQKQAFLEAHAPEHTLMLGDGLNDAPALATARCSGTPALDRPLLASRTDFFFTGARFDVIRTAVRASRAVRRTVLALLAMGALYNIIGLTLAVTGHMSPLLCAVLMPVSSIVLLAYASRALSSGAAVWTS